MNYEDRKIKSEYNWDVKKSGERLLWRFKDGKSFTPNKNDVYALEGLLKWVNRQASENINNNQLFAKLFIQHLLYCIWHSETTIIDPFPQAELSRLLEKPLDLFYMDFYNDIHNNQLNKLVKYNEYNKLIDKQIESIMNGEMKFLSYSDPRLYDESDERKEIEIKKKEKEKITKKQQDEIIKNWKYYKNEFDLNFVTQKLNLMISEALNRYSNV